MPLGISPQFLAVDSADAHDLRRERRLEHDLGDRRPPLQRANDRRLPGPAVDIPVGPEPFTLALNEATDSLYVTMLGAPTVAILDLRDCKAAELRGCLRPPVEFDVGEAPGGIAINRRTNTIYVTGQSRATCR